jgi:hypothetical protein
MGLDARTRVATEDGNLPSGMTAVGVTDDTKARALRENQVDDSNVPFPNVIVEPEFRLGFGLGGTNNPNPADRAEQISHQRSHRLKILDEEDSKFHCGGGALLVQFAGDCCEPQSLGTRRVSKGNSIYSVVLPMTT